MSETMKSKRKLEWDEILGYRFESRFMHLVCCVHGVDLWSDNERWFAWAAVDDEIISYDGEFKTQAQAQEWCQEYIDDLPDDFILSEFCSDSQESNRDFMRSVGQPVRDTPGMPSEEQRLAHFKIIFEEVLELADGWGLDLSVSENAMRPGFDPVPFDFSDLDVKFTEPDLVETADALADVAYTVLGAANASGIALQPILDEVCANNMLKVDKGEMVDGKLIKPKDHPKPDIEGLLKQQGWEVESV